MPTYKTRADAREYLQTVHGLVLGKTALENMAYKDEGPEYRVIAGRALYTAESLDAWVAAQAAKPVIRRRKRDQEGVRE